MPTTLFETLAKDWLGVLRTPPTMRQVAQFARYTDLLIQWNKRINLTSITEPDEIVVKHFLDSLSVLIGLEPTVSQTCSLIDIGSGAGFPGIALAIIRPTWQITLLEATRKKVSFLESVVHELGLANIRILWGRAEEFGRQAVHREQYEAAVARAVAELPVLAEYCLPFVRVGGLWVAQKGPKVEDEVKRSRNALGQLGGKLQGVESVAVPGMVNYVRSLVVVEKIKPTPATFPRRPR